MERTFVFVNGLNMIISSRRFKNSGLKRYLQKNVETLAAKLILAGDVGRGDTILIDVKDGKLTAGVKK